MVPGLGSFREKFKDYLEIQKFQNVSYVVMTLVLVVSVSLSENWLMD